MTTDQVLSIFLKGAMGSKGRKRARKAATFLTGNKGFLTSSALVGAAGVAWGIWETMQRDSGATGAPGASGAPGAPGGPIASGASGAAGATGPASEVLRIVRLAVSAARADGTLLPAERALILSHAREVGLESEVELELATPRPLSEIVAGVGDEQRRCDLYVLAFTMVRADESVSGAERIYLAQLAHLLGLPAAAVAQLEAETAARIDQTTEGA